MKRKPTLVVLLTVFIDLLGFGIVIPLLPFYGEHFGATPTVIGLLSSSYSLMQFLFIPFWGRLSDRLGRRPIIILSVLGSFISYMAFGFANSLLLLFLSRILGGFMGANISTAYAYIADSTNVEDRAKYMGLIGAAFGVGFMLGPFVGGITSKISYGAPGFVAAGLSLTNAVLAYFMLPESIKEKIKHDRKISLLNVPAIRDAFRKPAVGNLIMVSFFYTVAFSNLYVAFPLFTGDVFNYGTAANGYLFAYIGLIGILIQGGAIGKLVKKFGERGLIISGIVLLLGGLTFVPHTRSLSTLIVLVTMLAVGSALVTPPLTSLISRYAGTTEYGSVLGVSRSFSSLARVIGPFWGGFILGSAGLSWPFYTGGIMLLVALLLALRVPKIQPELAGDSATSK
ncbi:MAG: MFS transporter [Bacteroidetes bacterium]|nr:MFS transporter [Bacteroidota bacterium]